MTAKEMWAQYGGQGTYEAWQFGSDPDGLAALVLTGRKTATSSAFPLYALEGEPLPQPGEHSVILNSRDEAVCVIRTVKVSVVPFAEVTADHARLEGEGDRSLASWRSVHRDFFTGELREAGLHFDERMPVVCEVFEKVWP